MWLAFRSCFSVDPFSLSLAFPWQRAMHYLMQPDTWRKAGLPYYADHEVIRVHTAVIDQCAMNSYLVHPWQGLQGRTKDLGPAARYAVVPFLENV